MTTLRIKGRDVGWAKAQSAVHTRCEHRPRCLRGLRSAQPTLETFLDRIETS